MSASDAKCIVVKVGTSVVSRPDGSLALGRIGSVVEQIAQLVKEGRQVVLVASGAIGIGAGKLAEQAMLSKSIRSHLHGVDPKGENSSARVAASEAPRRASRAPAAVSTLRRPRSSAATENPKIHEEQRLHAGQKSKLTTMFSRKNAYEKQSEPDTLDDLSRKLAIDLRKHVGRLDAYPMFSKDWLSMVLNCGPSFGCAAASAGGAGGHLALGMLLRLLVLSGGACAASLRSE